MVGSLLAECGRGTGAELALGDWLEERGMQAEAQIARGLQDWHGRDAMTVLEAVRKAGGWRDVKEFMPWHDGKETALRIRKALWRAGRKWSVREAGGRVVISAAPSRSVSGRMTTADWHELDERMRKAQPFVDVKGWEKVEVRPCPTARRMVLEVLVG
jgi:hypothetical protein